MAEPNPADWILYLDPVLLVINKPAGLPALPDGYQPAAPHVKSLLTPLYGPLWIVHRLDRETSGVMALARSAAAHRSLNLQFDTRQVHKLYHALVLGCPAWQTLTVDQPLRPDGDRQHRTVIDSVRGKPAETELSVLARAEQVSLLQAVPHTGRTHQIRAHLAHVGYPIVGDPLYIKSAFRNSAQPAPAAAALPPGAGLGGLARLGLHALSLTLQHPETCLPLAIQAPYPPDFAAALAELHLPYPSS